MCFPASSGVGGPVLLLPFDEKTLILAERPPKGGAVLLSHLPKFLQREGVCVHVCV